jgi:hypothetical protein
VTVKLPDTIFKRARHAVSGSKHLTLAALVERSLTTRIGRAGNGIWRLGAHRSLPR